MKPVNVDWPVELSVADKGVLKLCKKQKLWGFLRHHRHLLFDAEVVDALQQMYLPVGQVPIDVKQQAMAMLLQVAFDVPDHEVPVLTVVDARWQMVLGCREIDKPLLSQGTVFNFRMRAMEAGAVSVLLEKTVELARETGGFSHKRLRAIIDSSPLLGAGRVEDTVNLLGRAIRRLAELAGDETDRTAEEVASAAGIDIVGTSSIKAWLDLDWRSPTARGEAVTRLIEQFDRLRAWLVEQLGATRVEQPPIGDQVELVERIIEQDTEPDPDAPTTVDSESTSAEGQGSEPTPTDTPRGARRIKKGVAHNRLISLSDLDMRHGRKTRTKTFNGYKRHVVAEADVPGLICATKLVPANVKEHEPVGELVGALGLRGFELAEAHVDRGYLPAPELHERRRSGLRLVTKPPAARTNGRFTKSDFRVDFANGTVTCPADHTVPADVITRFPTATCRACHLRGRCTEAKRGRTVQLHPEEEFHRQLAGRLRTPEGRQDARQRVPVEHVLARVDQIQGRRARFRGLAKNQFDLERVAVVNNCYILNRLLAA